VGGRKSPFPITLAIGLYNSLYYRTSRDETMIAAVVFELKVSSGLFAVTYAIYNTDISVAIQDQVVITV